MSPQGMTGMNSMGQVDDGSFAKAASAAMSSIVEMYKQAHIAQPGGPLASQLQMLMDGIADAEAEYMGAGSAATDAADPASAVNAPPMGDPMADDAAGAPPLADDAGAMSDMGMDPQMASDMAGGPPTSMDDAGAQLQTMLEMTNARKRP